MSIFPEPNRITQGLSCYTRITDRDSACYEDREFWKDEDRNGKSSIHSSVIFSSNGSVSSDSDSSSQSDIEAAVRILDKPRLPYKHGKTVRLSVLESYIKEERELLRTAQEILAIQGHRASSSFNSVTAQPLSSSDFVLSGKVKTAVAFDIPVRTEKEVCLSARVEQRLRRRGKVASELTLQALREKMHAAEERKLKELERIRDNARSRAGITRPHPVELFVQATEEKLVAKQMAAERRRNEEMERRKEAGKRVSRNRNRIAAARAFAKAQEEASVEREVDDTEQRKEKKQVKTDETDNSQVHTFQVYVLPIQ